VIIILTSLPACVTMAIDMSLGPRVMATERSAVKDLVYRGRFNNVASVLRFHRALELPGGFRPQRALRHNRI
jgi:hypothetical protein